ncbi:RrF2 family transcriptional regulator [Alteribacillus sp. HJP-4]|uniref:RrF2 family transcriptional regulator n=1 Tax=Alteribacillus sp. HJP-4 TaxID=2775394 RepID=UPI0035CCF0D0
MKYSKATNYALHTMVYLTISAGNQAVGVDQLAKVQHLSPTYLSKILTKLVKAGLIESTPGVKGGYRITKHSTDITFLDVIYAIEGKTSLFSCSLEHGETENGECLIENVMIQAEKKMTEELADTSILDIAKQIESRKFEENNCTHST